MKNKIICFFFFLDFLNCSLVFGVTVAELQDKYKLEIENTKKKLSFGFKESLAEKKHKKFLPFVVMNEGGVQNKLLRVIDSSKKASFIPLESEYKYKDNNFYNYNNHDYEKEKFYEDEDEDAMIDEILRSLEGL